MKKVLNKISKPFVMVAFLSLGVAGCDNFLNINTDPNNPLDSRLDQILPTAQTVIFEALGNGPGGISDFTSQVVHHTVQRGPSNFYFFGGNEFSISSAWPNLYSGALMDLEVMIRKGTERNSWHYLGIAQALKAYTFSQIVDLWGEAAYFEFGKGTGNPFPEFDNGEEIYPELLELLTAATTNLAKASIETPDDDDLIFGGDTSKWIRFANGIKLKLYNQVRLTPLYNATDVAAIIANAALPGGIDDGFKLMYGSGNNPENRHPLFKQDYADANANNIDPYFYLVMKGDPSLPVFNPLLNGIEDPRIPYYFYNQLAGDDAQNPVTSAKFGDFLSIWFASFNIDPNEGFDQAQSQTVVGIYPCGGALDTGTGQTAGVAAGRNPGLGGASYQRLFPYFSYLYTRAELALTKGAAGDARTLFEEAMEASFDEVDELAPVPVPNRATYINSILALYDAASASGKLELLMTEKWIASFGFTVDAYTDYRRTGFPIMFDPATDNNPFTILNRAFPVSLAYFIDDLAINPNAPPQRNLGTDKVFWDVD